MQGNPSSFSLKFLSFYQVMIPYMREVELYFLPLLWGSTKQFEIAYKLVTSDDKGISLYSRVLQIWEWSVRLRYF